MWASSKRWHQAYGEYPTPRSVRQHYEWPDSQENETSARLAERGCAAFREGVFETICLLARGSCRVSEQWQTEGLKVDVQKGHV